jgi:hemolysin activation/secretion protein
MAWRGQVQYLRLLAPDFIWLLRSDVQLANQSLLAQEQFSLGGASTVRGYRQDALLGDNGVFLSTELRVPVLTITDWDMVIQIIPFADWGMVWNQEKRDEMDWDSHTIFSTGVGLRLQLKDNLTAQIEWGIPLTDINTEGNFSAESQLHFLIHYKIYF